MADYLIFGRWPSKAVISDPGLQKYINLDARIVYNSQGKVRKLGKQKIHIVERLVNNMMRGGTGRKIGGKIIRDRGGCGKKAKMFIILERAFEIVEKKEKKSPLELLVMAIQNAAPKEDTTKVKYGGVVTPIPVDVSPEKRVNFALRNIARAMAIRSFDNKKSAEEALAEEIILASRNDASSHAIARKNETERTAASSR